MKRLVNDFALEYKTNEDFKEYVDKYCKKHGIEKEEAFRHIIVQEYFNYLLHKQ